MTVQIVFSLVAIVVPWLSVRTAWFIACALAAVALTGAGLMICLDGAQGWDGLGCLIVAILASFPVLASIVVGIVRVVKTGGGRRPGSPRTTIIAAAICYGLAVLLVILFVTMGK